MLVENYKVPYGDLDWVEALVYFYDEDSDHFQTFKMDRGVIIKTSGHCIDELSRIVGKKRLQSISYLNNVKRPMVTDYYDRHGKIRKSTNWIKRNEEEKK